jgi:hypothetical protein
LLNLAIGCIYVLLFHHPGQLKEDFFHLISAFGAAFKVPEVVIFRLLKSLFVANLPFFAEVFLVTNDQHLHVWTR